VKDYTSYINPQIGIDGPGQCLIGPYLPLSIVRLSPDTTYSYASSGYNSELPIVRFSHNHVSGTGGSSRYGNIGITPSIGRLKQEATEYEREAERAECGYYSVVLKPSDIKVELASTARVGLHRYTYPDQASSNILIDVGSVIQYSANVDGWPTIAGESTGRSIGGFAEIISDYEVIGRGDYKGGWGHEYPYSVYFYLKADQPFQNALLCNSTGVLTRLCVDGANCKVMLSFGETKVVNLQVGISYVSVSNARAHVETEVRDKDFDTIRNEAVATWNQSLSRIRVEGGDEEQRILFYTLFSRLLCMPSDLGVDDEFNYWKSGVRHFTDIYCMWDSVRNANSLISLFDPELEADLLNCFLDIAEHRGWFPDAWINGHSAFVQGGSSADILFCEAALKGIKGIDYDKALKYMRKNNEVESPEPDYYGRHLKDYRDLGYVSTNVKLSCVSRHLEYSYQDWCIGRLAEKLGYEDVARQYQESSSKTWNLWREDNQSFAPKHPDGEWVQSFSHTKYNSPYCWMDPYFYEGTSLQWSFSVHHDFYGLIERCGGNEAFIARLDDFFDSGKYHSKETMLHIPYLYIYAGRPDKTAERVRECMDKYYSVSRNGLSDNEDMGCQSAFYMCSAMGLYPVMGQDLYLLTSPVFTHIEVDLGRSGKQLVIKAPHANAGNKYVSSIKLNGAELDRFWLRHEEIADGAVLEFTLTDQANCSPVMNVPPAQF
jgi:predicted alpha-1,2-mannosidase